MTKWPRIRLDSRTPSARWNYAPREATLLLECDVRSRQAILRDRHRTIRTWDDPLAALEWMPRQLDELAARGFAEARWVGFLSYDLGRLFETLPARAVDDLDLPLFTFTLHESSGVATDGLSRSRLRPPAPLTSTFSRRAYLDAVSRTIEYIAAGDVFQVNLSQRFTAPLTEPPAGIYHRLRAQSPALFGAYLDYPDYALLCNSPELFLRVESDPASGRRRVTTRPIKGTRPRGEGMEAALRDSEKDRAELNMIIDLERNDLGRICDIGSVKVTEPRVIETHPTVYHGAATVQGLLREEVAWVDLLRATFPGGSITGAPKIRAMEIIEELEPVRRGPYCGAIGYLAPGGVLEFNIAIRTMIIRDGWVHIPVGGGIVADSNPVAEYDETLVKARAMFIALGISDDGATCG